MGGREHGSDAQGLRGFAAMIVVRAPWTDAQVTNLIMRQTSGHPYTCGNNSEHTPLVPTNDGWYCLDCDYTQDWARDVDLRSPCPHCRGLGKRLWEPRGGPGMHPAGPFRCPDCDGTGYER